MRNTEYFLFLFAGVISVLFSFWSSGAETVVNSDAICYLLSADAISQSGWQAVMQICPQAHWPFYSLLIFSVSHFFSIPSLLAAYWIDGFFSMISVLTFIALVREMGGGKRVLWFAVFTILFFHEFNAVRQYIVRDHGFWAFYSVSIFFLLRYFHYQRLFYIAGFYFSLILATLFRVEGAVFLLLLPIVSWWMPDFSYRKRFSCFVILYLPLLLIAIILSSYLQHHLGRVAEIMLQLKHGITLTLTHFGTTKNQLAQYVLKQNAVREAGFLLLLALIVWYGFYVVITLSLGYALLLISGFLPRNNPVIQRILTAYIIINIGITFIYFVQQSFLSKRYLVALALTLLLFVPFIIDNLLKEWRSKQSARMILSFSIILILVSALSSIVHFGYSKKYILDAGNWLAHTVHKQQALYTNDLQLMFYSEHFGLNIFKQLPIFLNQPILLKENWQKYDYIALRINQHDQAAIAMLKSIQQSPEKILMNSRGDRVVIYHNIKADK